MRQAAIVARPIRSARRPQPCAVATLVSRRPRPLLENRPTRRESASCTSRARSPDSDSTVVASVETCLRGEPAKPSLIVTANSLGSSSETPAAGRVLIAARSQATESAFHPLAPRRHHLDSACGAVVSTKFPIDLRGHCPRPKGLLTNPADFRLECHLSVTVARSRHTNATALCIAHISPVPATSRKCPSLLVVDPARAVL